MKYHPFTGERLCKLILFLIAVISVFKSVVMPVFHMIEVFVRVKAVLSNTQNTNADIGTVIRDPLIVGD